MTQSTDWWQLFPQGRQTVTIKAAGQEVKIAYGEAGAGQPLFLLHGLGSWSYNWRLNVEPLAEQFRVICIDAKGYGFSESTPLPETVGHQVTELEQMISALANQPVAIAAESLGALTALALAQLRPDLIERLILINVPVFPQQLPSWGMRYLSYLPLGLVNAVDCSGMLRWFSPIVRQVTRLIRQEVVVDPSQISDADLYWLTYPYLYRSGVLTQFAADLQLAAREIRRYQTNQPNLISQIQQQLGQVTCPALILWSDCDHWFPVQDGERLRDSLPNAKFQVLPNCGHVAASGNPTAVNQAILSFLCL